MDDRETSLSLARARLYTICLKERPVLVVSVGLEPSLAKLWRCLSQRRQSTRSL
jgi:hypothetical protein